MISVRAKMIGMKVAYELQIVSERCENVRNDKTRWLYLVQGYRTYYIGKYMGWIILPDMTYWPLLSLHLKLMLIRGVTVHVS
jgi:hypothetical protein